MKNIVFYPKHTVRRLHTRFFFLFFIFNRGPTLLTCNYVGFSPSTVSMSFVEYFRIPRKKSYKPNVCQISRPKKQKKVTLSRFHLPRPNHPFTEHRKKILHKPKLIISIISFCPFFCYCEKRPSSWHYI